ncbi:MAG: hypothetical protein IPK50_20855 [Fibrobacterota bacterium]|nr:hypothetical protein [Fibrobacterota bacterium]QQS04701.1 MAG: hypothetical protein IPK50_20855 [Fibrobacterota bacterium]
MTRAHPSRFAILAAGALLACCGSERGDRQIPSHTDSVHTDLARLGRILRWDSLSPRSASYRIVVFGSGSDRVPGPTDWSLEAILRYDSAAFVKVERFLKRDSLSDSVKTAAVVWDWLDPSDRKPLAKAPSLHTLENRLFPIEGCPFGKMQIAPSNTLLLWCHTR